MFFICHVEIFCDFLFAILQQILSSRDCSVAFDLDL